MLAVDAAVEFLVEGITVGQHHELDALLGGNSLHDGDVGEGVGFGVELADDELTGHDFYKTDIIGHDKTP